MSVDVSAAVILRDGKIFLARRGPTQRLAGFWEFPGGKVEQGETSESALKREIREEFGINIEVKDYVGENIHDYDGWTVNLRAYICRWVDGWLVPKEHDETAWVSLNELHEYRLAPADIYFIEQLGRFLEP
ncbi:(deoxy)nucleoside triphosphate pyrophosphohydrolase [Limisalsivibrio acetivorans]|uniref:(deoxy)nucleoside triphosphate pyrophosphohydrolase n=1 Tax=Limisalsivibrio acetivorans TaxID=1304888 RepID=UPI0003B2E60E|nr:(deoxy)nucleoside triphosphate pyrophosphohydrolase [Limisalsivibrio acetivorans]